LILAAQSAACIGGFVVKYSVGDKRTEFGSAAGAGSGTAVFPNNIYVGKFPNFGWPEDESAGGEIGIPYYAEFVCESAEDAAGGSFIVEGAPENGGGEAPASGWARVGSLDAPADGGGGAVFKTALGDSKNKWFRAAMSGVKSGAKVFAVLRRG
jgi:hypothetical protein